jgi:hypothetical protein
MMFSNREEGPEGCESFWSEYVEGRLGAISTGCPLTHVMRVAML